MSSTAERRVQLLTLIQAVMPALVESLVQPEPPKPKVEHKVVAYSFDFSVGQNQVPLTFDVSPPEGDGWKLNQLDLPSGLGHWTRVVLIDAEFQDDEKKDTISSPPPEPETCPEASEAPLVPCDSCHQFPHASTCPAK